LALLVLIFSVLWPYLKFTGLFLAWVLPVNILGAAGREKMLIMLDLFGKWSLIDIWITMFIAVALSTEVNLRFDISSGVGFEILWPFFGFSEYTFFILLDFRFFVCSLLSFRFLLANCVFQSL